MSVVSDYRVVTHVYESSNSLVYQAIRRSDDFPVILKILKQDYPTSTELTRYKHEYEITRQLDIQGVIQTYDLLPYDSTLAMILEDFGGQSLDIILQSRTFTVAEFLPLAIRITKILGDIHAANVIHKDINPSNIVFNAQTGQLKIIDFGISTIFTHENPTFNNPAVLEGTLAYMSPEQTGRMNRTLDYRTDFYSLGATFYQLLTQQLLFTTSDAMEWVHGHIARQCTSPSALNPDVPPVLSQIIMKLLAKTAEERYQSAAGLLVDLEHCLTEFRQTNTIVNFPLARHDISKHLVMPQTLYGREKEIDILLSVYNRVATPASQRNSVQPAEGDHPSKSEMMVVGGYAGIGKSVLIQQLYKPLTAQRGYFISGKFDQIQRNRPYSAVVSALQALVRQLLTESPAQLARWQEKLVAAFGLSGQMIIDVIPEIEQIVGSQPPLPQLERAEANNRFNTVFQNFIRVFCDVSHPLIMFLDDLQWADSASLRLMELMMMDHRTEYFLLLAAYRDHEVDANHPAMRTIERLQEQGVIVNRLTLGPLRQKETAQLLADALHRDIGDVASLADLLVAKTLGNPFFINEFLNAIHQENYLYFDHKQNSWCWDTTQLEALGITDNVVDLLICSLKRLPESAQTTLYLAACIGNQFDLDTLSTIYEKSMPETFRSLMPAIRLGLVQPTSALETAGLSPVDSELIIQHYKFRHDRIQQASYALIEESQKQVSHLKIGRLLLESLKQDELEEKIFTLTSHLNRGKELIQDFQERLDLVNLNIKSGTKAKEAASYVTAKEYLTLANTLFSENIWEVSYDTALALYRQLAEVEYLNGNLEGSQRLLTMSIKHCKSALDSTDFYHQQIVQHTLLGRYEAAIDLGRTFLKQLGYDLPEDHFQEAFETELKDLQKNLSDREIASLYYSPEMEQPEQKAALTILARVFPPAWVSNPALKNVIGTKIASLGIKYGHIPVSVSGYSFFGTISVSALNDYHVGYEYGALSYRLAEKYNHLGQKGIAAQLHGNMTMPWLKHVKFAEPINVAGIEASLQAGERQTAGYTLTYNLYSLIYQGKNINTLLKEATRSLQFVRETQNQWAINCILAAKMIIQNIAGPAEDYLCFDIEEIQESQFLRDCQKAQTLAATCFYLVFKGHVQYLYHHPMPLSKWDQAAELLGFIPATMTTAKFNFYYSLTLISYYADASSEERNAYWKKLESNQQIMKTWAENCQENFLHKYLLVEAEMSRLSGQWYEAMDLYDRAIESARDNEFIQNEALSNELAAKFWLEMGKEDFAQLYLKKSRQAYQIWGAGTKVKILEAQYPRLLLPMVPAQQPVASSGTSYRHTSSSLELNSVLKASQAISSEIILEKLLDTLMRVVIENAGAQKGCLILETDGQWVVEAEKSADSDDILVLQSLPLNSRQDLPITLIRYVERMQEEVVLSDATQENLFANDPYVVSHHPKSVLCMPLMNHGQLTGILYLENNLIADAFNSNRLLVLNLLVSQEVISIENARLYHNLQDANAQLEGYSRTLEQRVADRTQELQEKNQELEIANGKIVQATQKKTQFFNNMSHELRTPLDAVIGFSEVLQEQTFGALNAQQEEYVGYIMSSGTHLLGLINDLLDMAKHDAGMMNLRLESFNLSSLLQDCLVLVRERALEHGIALALDVAEDIETVLGDEQRIKQIVINLLSNAVKFTPNQGRVGIQAARVDQQIEIAVWDTGIGIAPEHQRDIFSEFQQFGRQQGQGVKGTGLGLALTKKLVELHKGTIAVESGIGEGSVFTFTLPINPN